ncbi:DUF2182 domain-containing protein [Ruegeria faecimaris]|uniref:copper chaperone n=1 Tax=Ruegeria faecimaris TaxID=686389 RepID=UPI0024914F91|nr:DUF2182 domain-containing protein [Ruegeria faecimaris]
MASATGIDRPRLFGRADIEIRTTLGVAALAWLWLALVPAPSLHWPAMVLAMMLPTLVPQIAHVRERSFADRRSRAALLFVLPYLLAWLVAGALAAFLLAPVLHQTVFAPLACLCAAAWQFSPQKRSALRKCHSRPVLAAFGPSADRDVLIFGLTYARDCITSCLPMMLVMLGTHDFAVMIFLTVIILSERAVLRPDPRASAFTLLLTALALTALAHAPHHLLLLYKDICHAGI